MNERNSSKDRDVLISLYKRLIIARTKASVGTAGASLIRSIKKELMLANMANVAVKK